MRALLLALALLAAPVSAQDTPPLPQVMLETGLGPIVVELETAKAPVTSANFLRYVREKRLDGTDFYRAMRLAPDAVLGLVQGGVKGDPKRSLPAIRHEPTTQTGLSHRDGTISLARAAPGSATADFFILVGDIPSLDANPTAPGDNQGFAAFGRVVEGMDVVRRILSSPTSPTLGEGVMKGQMLEPAVPIIRARLLP
jgi:peptidyl-prolyl cis-trans isomerase A (cyclophilin A)